MGSALAALEFDRILTLVGSFARSQQGRKRVLATLPRFRPGEGSQAFAATVDVGRLVAAAGSLSFAGLDAVELLRAETVVGLDTAQLFDLTGLVRRVVETRAALGAADAGRSVKELHAALPGLDAFLAFLDQRLGPGGEILDSASPALASARAGRERHRREIVQTLERIVQRNRSISGPFTVRRERYCVPVPSGEKGQVKGLVLDVSGSGATFFVEPFDVVDLNNALAEASARAREEEERVVREIASAFARRRDELVEAAGRLAELDAIQARALFGSASGGVLLEPGGGRRLRLVEARHPLLDPALAPLRRDVLGAAGNTGPVIPLDLDPPAEARVILLSGPNAGGKTVALKTVGVTALMAQCGIPVLASAESALPPISGVWSHVGDEQNLLSDLSTFSGAMRATAELLDTADADSLVLYDELGSGTDPEEGAALAAALLEELVRRGCWTLATAHLTTVAAHLEGLDGAVNAAMGFDEATGRPDYTLELGVPGQSRGLAIAHRSGVAPAIIERARGLLSRAFLAIDTYLQRLQEERDALHRQRDSLAEEEARARDEGRRLAAERTRLDAERDAAAAALDAERDALRRRAKEKLDAALSALQKARDRGELPGRKRQAAIRREALDLAGDRPAPDTAEPAALAPGDRVRVSRSVGEVRQVTGDRIEVILGGKRLWVDRSDCEIVPGERRARTVETRVLSDAPPPPGELKLIGMTSEEAREELERFLDRALVSGIVAVRVVHGHGSGTLRRVVREVLADHPAVGAFRHPPQARGGTGVTEAELRP